jgi:uncharacterized membrane protein
MSSNNSNNESFSDSLADIAAVLKGKESIKFEIQFEGASVAMVLGGALLVGILLIYINHKL